MIAAIILAAGQSRRMGTQKLLLPFAGRTVIGQIAGEILRSPIDQAVAVLGADAARVAEALFTPPPLVGPRLALVTNPDPDGEMLSSVRCGLRALPADCEAVLVTLGDQPTLTAELIGRLLDAFRRSVQAAPGRRCIVTPVHAGKRGHPILFSWHYRPEILTAYDDTGLRGLLAAHPSDVVELLEADPSVLADIDRPDDYRRALEAAGDSGDHPRPC